MKLEEFLRDRELSAYSYLRGHLIVLKGENWVYADTSEPITVERPCARCGRMPTPEGHDACLGTLLGIEWACCGHGVLGQAYIVPILIE